MNNRYQLLKNIINKFPIIRLRFNLNLIKYNWLTQLQ